MVRVASCPQPISQKDDTEDVRRYPKGLFNKGIRAKNEDHIGHVMKETMNKIVIFGDYNYRFDVPKSRIYEVGRNIILDVDFPELMKYKVDREISGRSRKSRSSS